MSRPAPLLLANLTCMLSMLVWAAGLPAADILIRPLQPLPLSAVRMAMAAAVLLPVWWLVDGAAAVRTAPWGKGMLIGGGAFGLGAFLIVLGQSLTDAVTVAVISATMPVIGIALECVLDGRKLTSRVVLGLVLSLAGGLVAYASKFATAGFGIGALLSFVSILAFTWGSRATVTAFPELTAIGRTAITLTGAAVTLGIAAALMIGLDYAHPAWTAIGLREVNALLIYGILSLAISQVLWIVAVGRLGIGLASMHINAAPFYVMVFVFALGGAWRWQQVAGAAVVALGVLIAQSSPKATAARQADAAP